MMSLKKVVVLAMLVTSADSACTFRSGCQACADACYDRFGHRYFCCYGNSCCCFPGPGHRCNEIASCPANNCEDKNVTNADPNQPCHLQGEIGKPESNEKEAKVAGEVVI